MAAVENTGILLKSGSNELEIIEVYIDEEGGYRGHYGINVAKVLEIIRMPEKVSKPPNAAQFVAGVFNHRGKVIMLLDLACWLGIRQVESNKRIVIITEFNQVTSAFVVSGVTRIHRTSWANIKPVDEYLQNYCDAITGTILLDGKTFLMLDLERTMGALDPRMAVPYHESDEDEGHSDLSSADRPGLLLPIKILHADDSRMIRRSLKEHLESNGEFQITSVIDGKQAWDYLLEAKRKATEAKKPLSDFVDMVLSDIEMPEMDGYHLCQRVKNDPELQGLPFILFSSMITEKLHHKGNSVGADAQFTKPSPAELVRELKKILTVQRHSPPRG